MPASQNLSLKFNVLDNFGTLMHSVPVVLHGLLTLHNVLKHRLDLVDRIVSAFYLQLLDHELFCFIGNTSLVEKPLREQTSKTSNKYITTMETTKQPDNGVQSLFDFVIGQ